MGSRRWERGRRLGIRTAITEAPPAPSCELCGSETGATILEKNAAAYRRCGDCGFIYSNLSEDESRSANEDYFAAELAHYVERTYASRKQKIYDRRLAGLSVLHPGRRLLEIGANVGGFLDRARVQGYAAVGVEPVEPCAAWARDTKGLDVRTGTLEEVGLEEASFDIVYANAVFEHLRHPGRVMAEVARVLAPGGLAVIDTVNWHSYTRERLGADWKLVDPRVHLCLYTPESLSRLCEQAGLEVRKVATHGVRLRPNAAPRLRGLARLLEEVRKFPLSAASRVTKKGDSVLVIARRPESETAPGRST